MELVKDEEAVLVVVQITHDGCVLDVCYDEDPFSDNYGSITLPKVPDGDKLKAIYPNAEIKYRDRR